MRGNAIMRARMPALAIIVALLGFCVQANAQALCPQLTRLRNEAQETLKQSRTVPASERCYMYNRLSRAWDAVVQYANDNRESCHISISSLNEFERYHSGSKRARQCLRRPAPSPISTRHHSTLRRSTVGSNGNVATFGAT
jgi:hypothetical protein